MTDKITITDHRITSNGAPLTTSDKPIDVTPLTIPGSGDYHYEVRVTLLTCRILGSAATDDDLDNDDTVFPTPIKITKTSVTYGRARLRTNGHHPDIELLVPGNDKRTIVYGVTLTLIATDIDIHLVNPFNTSPLTIHPVAYRGSLPTENQGKEDE